MFKATTRRNKYPAPSEGFFEGLVIEYPLAVYWIEPRGKDEGYWGYNVPSLAGFTVLHNPAGSHATKEEALARLRQRMLADGWRETREEAEADLAEELEFRANYRGDGTPGGWAEALRKKRRDVLLVEFGFDPALTGAARKEALNTIRRQRGYVGG